jgi:Domain of unknown function (DUF4349)
MMSNLSLVGLRNSLSLGLLVVGAIGLNSCSNSASEQQNPANKVATGSVANASVMSSPASAATREQAAADEKTASTNGSPASTARSGNRTPAATAAAPQKPQLIKTADLSLRLDSIDKAVGQIRKIVQGQQGDIYNFQDDRSPENTKRQASLVLKVPSNALDSTLAEISKLGQIQSQSIKSDDVTQQLVDSDARLKNLRQQEELTRKIMERSGSIRDILTVSDQLAEIRQQIEQIDATVKNLRQQVAYSTINLKVEEIQSTIPSSDPLGVRVQDTWKSSTSAATGLATGLGLTLLWLLPFSPFIGLGAAGFYYFRKRQQQRSQPLVVNEAIDHPMESEA